MQDTLVIDSIESKHFRGFSRLPRIDAVPAFVPLFMLYLLGGHSTLSLFTQHSVVHTITILWRTVCQSGLKPLSLTRLVRSSH